MSEKSTHPITSEIPADATYEELVAQLEASVERLESGDLSLEEAVHEYEFGMTLIEHCNRMLDQAELRVTELSSRARIDSDSLEDEYE